MTVATRIRVLRLWPWLAVAVAVSLVLAMGGFARRTDNLVPTGVGVEIDSQNLVFTFTGATLQSVTRFSGDPEWRVVAAGSVRNPHDATLYPLQGATGNFILFDRASGRTAEPATLRIGESEARTLVPPGNTVLPLAVTFTLAADYVPQSGIELALPPMEYTDNVVLGLGGGKPNWNVDSNAPVALLQLQLTRLADDRG